jgi:hypothetical protein
VARAQAARVQAKPTNTQAAGESAVAGIAAAAAGVGNRSQAAIQASPGSSNT